MGRLAEILAEIEKVAGDLAQRIHAVSADTETSEALGTTDAERARAALGHLATGRGHLADLTRMLAEFSALELDMTQRDVARHADISTQTINRWIKNSTTRLSIPPHAEDDQNTQRE